MTTGAFLQILLSRKRCLFCAKAHLPSENTCLIQSHTDSCFPSPSFSALSNRGWFSLDSSLATVATCFLGSGQWWTLDEGATISFFSRPLYFVSAPFLLRCYLSRSCVCPLTHRGGTSLQHQLSLLPQQVISSWLHQA